MNEEIRCEMVGLLKSEKFGEYEQPRRVWSIDGICPTLMVCSGGGLNIKILEPCGVKMVRTEEGKKLRKSYENKEIHHGFNEHRKAEPINDGTIGTITTVSKDSMVFEPKACAIRGRTDEGKYKQKLEIGGGISNAMTTVEKDTMVEETKVRIRYLTEKERFRLMGVRDEDFEKIKKHQSRSSLCYLSGDSIVVDVLMAIFKQMKKQKN